MATKPPPDWLLDLARQQDIERASRAKRFAPLDVPFRVKRRAGELGHDHMRRQMAEQPKHEVRMLRLLVEKHGIDPRDPQANVKLLTALVREYVPAFRHAESDGPGRPRKISDEQVRYINKRNKTGQGVLSICEEMVGTVKAPALAQQYWRATKKAT